MEEEDKEGEKGVQLLPARGQSRDISHTHA